MNRIELLQKVEKAKENLPRNIIPIFQLKFPVYNTEEGEYKVRRVLDGKLNHDDILEKLEMLSDYFADKVK